MPSCSKGLALLYVLTLCLACAPRATLTCPERGGPAWSEVASPHLVLRTDLDPAEARRLSTELEGLFGALAHVMPRPRRALRGRLEVVVLERREDYASLRWPEHGSAGFSTRKLGLDFEPQPIIVFYLDPRVGPGTVFLHELAHRFLGERFASLPPWLDEGLAQLYSTIRVDGRAVVIGERLPPAYVDFAAAPPWDGLRVPVETAPTVGQLLSADERAFHAPDRRAQRYAAAWRLSHLLAGRSEARFASFLDDLARGASAREAFARAFGDDLSPIEAAYAAYLGETRLPTRTVAYEPSPEAPRRHRLMRDAEVHLLWARLRPSGRHVEEAIAGDLDEALAHEPAPAEERYLRAALYARLGREDDAVRELDLALAARPDNPRYLHARLVVRAPPGDGEEPRRALLERLSRVAASAEELGLLADEYGVVEDRVHEGLFFAERGLRADPMCWWCEKTRSRILLRERRYAEAVAAADRALALAPEGEPAKGLRSERAFLATLRDAERSLTDARARTR